MRPRRHNESVCLSVFRALSLFVTEWLFKRTLIYFNRDTQYAHFPGNPLYQAFIGLIKGISPKMCVRVQINNRLFEPFCGCLSLSVSICVCLCACLYHDLSCVCFLLRLSCLSNILECIHMSLSKGMNKGSKAR